MTAVPWSLRGSSDWSRVVRECLDALRREKAVQREGLAGADTERAGGQVGMGLGGLRPVSQQRIMENVVCGLAPGTHARLGTPAPRQ